MTFRVILLLILSNDSLDHPRNKSGSIEPDLFAADWAVDILDSEARDCDDTNKNQNRNKLRKKLQTLQKSETNLYAVDEDELMTLVDYKEKPKPKW
eukprot:CAMPEP_0114226530 /NCGR_PEP_ID=MMETSP0058-20121206/1285_1 /TAXON_ID=36894 /ORGANISM="Pyramimonas parkeae, CCMP726" /LENGTH=95 /DNA_ID=CAMNT_0001337269 /DNA_START=1038 /DNA_END=1323 /DNA_ORIENTATION=+